MTLLVGKEGKQILGMHTLVYTQLLTHVLLNQYPIICMIKLIPFTKAAQVLLVVLLQSLTIYLIVSLQREGRYWEGIQKFFLRHQRTPLSSWCLVR